MLRWWGFVGVPLCTAIGFRPDLISGLTHLKFGS
jgi:hypothetical protein